jgi:competence/damage-inducible protein CinA-like protein
MKVSLIAVGSEMLTPFRLDTNSLVITERLNAIGADVRMKTVVGDDVEELVRTLTVSFSWADLVVITGGLGPTEDDITRDAVSRVLDAPLEIDERIVAGLRERFAKRGYKMASNNVRQAMVPRGAVVLDNPNGSAPGLWMERGRTSIVLLPGPPREMTPMLDAVIRDRLQPRAQGAGLFRRVLKITGRPESEVDAIAEPVYKKWIAQPVPISTTILAVLGQIELHLTASAASREIADKTLESAVAELQAVLGPSVYSVDGRPLEAIVGEMLRERRLTIAIAESCTGGLLTSRLTDVPGSSDYVERGFVCYSNRSKTELVGVDPALIEQHGAVSEPVASAMAEGAAIRTGTAIGIGITGIAGPGGGTEAKPVGTVVVAVKVQDALAVRTFRLFGSREMVKFQAAQAAMNMLRLELLRRESGANRRAAG